MTDIWRAEAEAAMRARSDGFYPAPMRPVGLCGVCHTPVLPDHSPTPIEWVGTGETGVIHGAFDCMDQPRCEAIIHISASGMETTARCVLPANHTEGSDEHIAGDPD